MVLGCIFSSFFLGGWGGRGYKQLYEIKNILKNTLLPKIKENGTSKQTTKQEHNVRRKKALTQHIDDVRSHCYRYSTQQPAHDSQS